MKKKLNHCIAHADYLYDKLVEIIKDDFARLKDWFGEKDYFKKFSEEELEKYVEDIIVDDGLHSHKSIVNTFKFLEPFFADDFVYFIEDIGRCENDDIFKDINSANLYYIADYDNNMMVIKRK